MGNINFKKENVGAVVGALGDVVAIIRTNIPKKMEKSKLLAAIAILAMIVCAFAVAVPADSVEGAPMNVADVQVPGSGTAGVEYIEITSESDTEAVATDLIDAINDSNVKTIVITFDAGNVAADAKTDGEPTVIDISTTNITIGEGKTLFIGATGEKNGYRHSNGNGGVTNSADGSTLNVVFGSLTVEGSVYNNLGQNKATTGIYEGSAGSPMWPANKT